jgi:hypothetical protein
LGCKSIYYSNRLSKNKSKNTFDWVSLGPQYWKKKFMQPGCTGAHLQPTPDACHVCVAPASESSAILFKPSQASATKEKNWSHSFRSRATGSQLNFFPEQRSSAAAISASKQHL